MSYLSAPNSSTTALGVHRSVRWAQARAVSSVVSSQAYRARRYAARKAKLRNSLAVLRKKLCTLKQEAIRALWTWRAVALCVCMILIFAAGLWLGAQSDIFHRKEFAAEGVTTTVDFSQEAVRLKLSTTLSPVSIHRYQLGEKK